MDKVIVSARRTIYGTYKVEAQRRIEGARSGLTTFRTETEYETTSKVKAQGVTEYLSQFYGVIPDNRL